MRYTYLILLLVGFLSCAKEKMVNFSAEKYEGISLEGEIVHLANINASRLALNVYSPTCVPCVKEIPTLNFLYHEFKDREAKTVSGKNAGVKLYMVVDPYTVVPDSERMEESSVIPQAIKIMQREVLQKKIDLPVLVMKKPFTVADNWLVTGTPETLLFHTNPLVLYYNFVGSISEETNPEKLKLDTKVSFFKKMLGH